jgi:hypothetical protein
MTTALERTAMDRSRTDEIRAQNRRTALILASVAAAFFFGIMLKYWLIR